MNMHKTDIQSFLNFLQTEILSQEKLIKARTMMKTKVKILEKIELPIPTKQNSQVHMNLLLQLKVKVIRDVFAVADRMTQNCAELSIWKKRKVL